jgi:hypothetical protein
MQAIRRLAQRAERRIRLGRALRAFATALCAALVVAILDVALRKLGVVGETPARAVLALAGAAVVAAAIAGWVRRLPDAAGARALDRFHGLHDRLANALAFEGRSGELRTPLMEAAIEDAVRAAPAARPAQAVPVRVPRALGGAAALAALLTAVLLFEVRRHVPVAHATTIDPMDMAPDDLDDVKDFLQKLEQKDTSDDTKAAIQEFNKLVDDIANKRLDRTEAFRRMESLEQRLLTGSEADKKALEAQLEKIGEEMKKAELTKPAGEALAQDKLDQARDALHDLAKKMREQGSQIDKAKLEQMREALKKSAADAERRRQAIEQRRQELADEILKRKQHAADAGANEEEQSLLKKKERELERLDRELDQQKNAGRQLDRLDRELQQAAEDLMKDMGMSAQDLDQGAEDINHMQEQEMTQQQKEELRQKLQEMRELMRQQGQGGKGQIVRLRRFGRMARGQGGAQGGQQGQGQGQGQGQQGDGQGDEPGSNGQGQGQGSDGQQGNNGQGGQRGQGGGQGGQNGQGQGGQGGQNGQGQSGQGQGPGQGQGGQGQGGSGGEVWVLGPNGEKMLMLSKGQGGGGSGQGGSGGQGQSRPGPGWGEGHDPNVQGGATNPKMGTEDTQVQAGDTGQGGSRSQVILGAAERGFASRGYKNVYTEYHQVAEESLAKDDIPGGYRFYVKRYFQLIRPRE